MNIILFKNKENEYILKKFKQNEFSLIFFFNNFILFKEYFALCRNGILLFSIKNFKDLTLIVNNLKITCFQTEFFITLKHMN